MGNIFSLNSVYYVIGLLCAIIPHEVAHGYAAYKFGDTTARDMGRLSFNPVKHLDILGFLSLLVFKFGWAKPVPINPNRFKNKKVGMIVVSLAGIITNLILFFISCVLMLWSHNKGYTALFGIFKYILIFNLSLALFNILPLPPLDGSKVVLTFLPRKWQYYFYKNERYLYIILVALIFTGVISKIIEGPMDFFISLGFKLGGIVLGI